MPARSRSRQTPPPARRRSARSAAQSGRTAWRSRQVVWRGRGGDRLRCEHDHRLEQQRACRWVLVLRHELDVAHERQARQVRAPPWRLPRTSQPGDNHSHADRTSPYQAAARQIARLVAWPRYAASSRRSRRPIPNPGANWTFAVPLHAAGRRRAVGTGDRRLGQPRHRHAVRRGAPRRRRWCASASRAWRSTSARSGCGRARRAMWWNCRASLLEQHGGEVPREREALEALPGVGRKTANVVLNVAFGESTMAVDTHMFRLGNRTGLAPGATRRGGEGRAGAPRAADLLRHAHHWLILHGRYVCKARMPECWRCVAAAWCKFPPRRHHPSRSRRARSDASILSVLYSGAVAGMAALLDHRGDWRQGDPSRGEFRLAAIPRHSSRVRCRAVGHAACADGLARRAFPAAHRWLVLVGLCPRCPGVGIQRRGPQPGSAATGAAW